MLEEGKRNSFHRIALLYPYKPNPTKNTMTTSLGSCIIVGGGPAGIGVAKGLQKQNVDVTVVDRQDYLDWSLASPRSLVAPDDIKKYGYVMPLDKVCEFVGAKFVQGSVKSISAKSVTLQDGSILEADCIVIAIGGQYAAGSIWKPLPHHTTAEKRIEAFQEQLETVKKASNIVVVGAGFAGVEISGELKASFLQAASDSKRTRARMALEKMDVILKDGRIEASEPDANKKVTTSNGETIDADLILNAAGFVYAAASLVDSRLKDSVTARGQLDCKSTLQLKSSDTVFAVGDIVAVPAGSYADVKGMLHAETTGKTVSGNIVKLLSNNATLQDFPWATKPVQYPCMSALGPNVGVGDLGLPRCMTGVGNLLCRKLKCADYYMSIQGANFGKGKTWN